MKRRKGESAESFSHMICLRFTGSGAKTNKLDKKVGLNTTTDYHVNKLNSLGWELTVCNALYPEDTPIRKILTDNDSYGHLLYKFLKRYMPVDTFSKIVEIGGGYGYLMRDLFDLNPSFQALMIDISPYLIGCQREMLADCNAVFREEDFLTTDAQVLGGFDLAIVNENLGDFPTLVNVDAELLQSLTLGDENIEKMKYFFGRYGLNKPPAHMFHFNLGALQVVEKLCASGIPYIFLGEHSCEATVPDNLNLPVHVESRRTPEKISLMGHDEYSIQISYLQEVVKAFGYAAIRGPFADFIPFTVTEELQSIIASQGCFSDDGEIICHFIEDLFKYEYLVLRKPNR